MQKISFVIFLFAALCLTGCNFNESNSDSKDIENYEKQLEASLAKIVNEQKRLIETNATLEELESNANTYYDFVSEKIYGNKDLSDTFM